VPVQPNIARFSGASARFTSIPVRRAHRHPGPQHRRRLAVADQRPGRLPEHGLHHVRRHQHPPVRDHLLRRNVPFQGERDVRQQPARRASDSQYDPSGIRVIATISQMTSHASASTRPGCWGHGRGRHRRTRQPGGACPNQPAAIGMAGREPTGRPRRCTGTAFVRADNSRSASRHPSR
jgi:hypothetical protein